VTLPLYLLPVAVALLQACAAITYASQGQYRLAVVWFGVALSNAALAGIR
jgi:hypothetical protein